MGEVLRHLIESGGVRFVDGRWVVPDPDQIDVPEGVRDVIGQRLSMLSDVTNEVLRAASVVGREFDLDLVGELAGIDEDPLLDAIDDATRARLVEEVDADRFRFAHALVRTSLYDELSASRRRRMHRRVTDLIAKRTPDDLAALAFHSVEAGPRGGDLSDAIAYVLAAADQAREAPAHSARPRTSTARPSSCSRRTTRRSSIGAHCWPGAGSARSCVIRVTRRFGRHYSTCRGMPSQRTTTSC